MKPALLRDIVISVGIILIFAIGYYAGRRKCANSK